MRTKRWVVRPAAAAAAMLALAIATSAASAQSPPQVVASGLDSPRHLTFSADGELYVVEAGRGGSVTCGVAHPALGSSCLGFSGAVTLVRDNGADERVLTGLPSIAGEPRPWGPRTSRSPAARSSCSPSDLVAATSSVPRSAARRACWAPWSPASSSRTAFSLFADVLANEAAANPDGTDIDSNPVGLVRQGEGYILADAGGNAVVRASHKGTFTTITALPPGQRARAAVPGPAAGHADSDGRRADIGGPGSRRRLLHQPVDGLPVRAGRRQHLARRSRPGADRLRLGAHQPDRPGLRSRRIPVRGRDRK